MKTLCQILTGMFLLAIVAFTTHPNHSFTKEKKEASQLTIDSINTLRGYLPFEDSTDFKNSLRGFIATIPEQVIYDDKGDLSYSMKQYSFLNDKEPNTVNPSLWRQNKLNNINGLFKVEENIYQVRGIDLSNMTFIKGKTGWIVIDAFRSRPPVEAAMRLVKENIGDFPVKAVLITHSHMDHFGGIRSLVSEEDIKSGNIKVFAPEGYFEQSISENVMAGNTMNRRSLYMYGNLLPKNSKGTIGSGLGITTSSGLSGIVDASDIITAPDGENRIIDGVKVEFINTPDAEAPSEMMFYFPEMKALCQAEEINHTLHNLYTLRGAQVRNGQKWSQFIDKCIAKYGSGVEVSFGTHHWPTWGNKEIVEFWSKQRDIYRFIHDQTLRLANQGYTPLEIAEMIKIPKALDTVFYNRGTYGSVNHDVKAQYQLYFGWFDGNPANLNPLPPEEAGAKYVEMMGGSDRVIAQAKKYFDKGEYRWVAEVMKHVVFSEPQNLQARYLLADTYEQLGYVAESGPWRNFYLTGAMELRNGVNKIPMATASSMDFIKGMSSELFFNYLAMRYKGTEENTNQHNFNIVLTDTNENVGIILSNGTVNTRVGSKLAEDVTATIKISRLGLAAITSAKAGTSVDDLIKDGKIAINGDSEAFKEFISHLDNFELWFNITEP